MAFIDELGQHLHNNSIGALGTSLFKGYLPPEPASAICVMESGGVAPDPYIPTKSPTFQVLIRAADYATGKTYLDSVRTAFHKKFNTQLVIGGTYFYKILAIAEGGHIGRDDNGRDMFSINFQCLTR